MCGIVAILSQEDTLTCVRYELFAGLELIQNRGYDSCGMMLVTSKDDHNHDDSKSRALFKIASTSTANAISVLQEHLPLMSNKIHKLGICHTRWASHGPKTTVNAHPHAGPNHRFYVVHNGIITNYKCLKNRLIGKGYQFVSDTDTEIVSYLMAEAVQHEPCLVKAWQMVINELEGTWALVMCDALDDSQMYVSKNGSPLLMSYNHQKVCLSSEVSGFACFTQQYIDLPNHSTFVIQRTADFTIQWMDEQELLRSVVIDQYHSGLVKTYAHQNVPHTPMPFHYWTNKEIHEQPNTLWQALSQGGRLYEEQDDWKVKLGGLSRIEPRLRHTRHVVLTGCGTSYHACLFALPTFRKSLCFVSVTAVDASEFVLTDLPQDEKVVVIVVSQSGETKDCQRVIRLIQEQPRQIPVIGVVNGVSSWIARESDAGVYMNAGREVGVGSTKSFTSSCVVLNLICLFFMQLHNVSLNRLAPTLFNLSHLFQAHFTQFDLATTILCPTLQDQPATFILGRSYSHSIALEAALKLKELTYQNCEGYAGGALKHGPFALIDEKRKTPIFLNIWKGPFRDVMLSAVEETKSRGAYVVVLTNDQSLIDHNRIDMLNMLYVEDEMSASLLSILFYQLLAFKLSVRKGINPDYPRNLAKVVTIDG